jgi:6-pyruvoyltetrahydropterin/6-carboxytetrahydropterin synthase
MNHVISKDFTFSMGHALTTYTGNCHNLHGHNYKLSVAVGSDNLDPQGFVMDFGTLKAVVNETIDAYYDHQFLIFKDDPRVADLQGHVRTVDYEPTAENLIQRIMDDVDHRLIEMGFNAVQARLWETDTASAYWTA